MQRIVSSARFPSIYARRLSRISGIIISVSSYRPHNHHDQKYYKGNRTTDIVEFKCGRFIRPKIVGWDQVLAIKFLKFELQTVIYTDCSPQILVYSDGSKFACGAHIMLNKAIADGMRAEHEVFKSSTWREIKAIHLSLLSCLPFLRQKKSILEYRQ